MVKPILDSRRGERSRLAASVAHGWAMPPNTEPVVTSAFADTPVDIRERVREIVATRTIADTLYDQRLAAAVSRIEGVDQAGLAELAPEGQLVASFIKWPNIL